MEENEFKEVGLNPESIGLKDNNNKRKKILIISGICLCALAIITAIILIITLNNKEEEEKDTKPKGRNLLDIEKLKKYKKPYYYYNTSLLNETIDKVLKLAKKHDMKIQILMKKLLKSLLRILK